MATSYAAGRYKQLTQPDFQRVLPFWPYNHSDCVMHPRPLHMAWHGLTPRRDHPFWKTHFPPNDWGCQCRVTAVTKREGEASARAGLGQPPDCWDAVDSNSQAPAGIDKGVDYTPGAGVDRPLREFVAEKPSICMVRLGRACGQPSEWTHPQKLTRGRQRFRSLLKPHCLGPCEASCLPLAP